MQDKIHICFGHVGLVYIIGTTLILVVKDKISLGGILDKLNSLFNKIEDERIKLIGEIKNLSIEELNRVPAQGKWSILQIIFHLVKTEKIAVISIQKNLKEKDKVKTSGFRAAVRFNIMRFALRTSLKFKAPAIVAKVPVTYDFNALLKQWETARKSLKEIIENFPPGEVNTGVFTHPYSGDLNIVQTFTFILEHFKHHKRQVINIIKN